MESLEAAILEHPFWKGLNPNLLPLVIEGAWPMSFTAGEPINREGAEATRFCLIRRGRVALEAFVPGKGPVTIQTIGRGDVLGWSWLFPPCRWYFGASALEETEVIAYYAEHLRAKIQANHEFGYELMTRMARVLLDRLQATRMQLLDLYATQH
jgi:CRP-like cAMP-binding protein